jgi:hypothetical protein
MNAIEPPNYGPQQARFGPDCEHCVHYLKGICQKYDYAVRLHYLCDAWEKNTSMPVEVH